MRRRARYRPPRRPADRRASACTACALLLDARSSASDSGPGGRVRAVACPGTCGGQGPQRAACPACPPAVQSLVPYELVSPPLGGMFRLRTFGGAALFDGDRPLDGPAVQRRRIALLALLAVAGDAGLSRDKLLAFLWPETDTERARHTLSQWLHLLRRDLRSADVVQGNADLRLNEALMQSDVRAFERAVARGELQAAVDLYAGPFL